MLDSPASGTRESSPQDVRLAAITKAVDELNSSADLAKLYQKYGIDKRFGDDHRPMSSFDGVDSDHFIDVDGAEWLEAARAEHSDVPYEILDADQVSLSRRQVHGHHYTPANIRRLLRRIEPQEEIGRPGTRIVNGRIEVEHNMRLRPFQIRGCQSRPGIAEEIYRSEPVVFRDINEITSLLCAATYEPVMPDRLRGNAALEHVMWMADRHIKACQPGFASLLRNAATSLKHGFACFEIVWDEDRRGFIYPKKIAFREQSTVDQWIFDDRQSDLLGAQFRTGGGSQSSYVLPFGHRPETARLLVVNINASGNDIEGIGLRPAVGLRKLKELILQIFGVSYQKNGVPIAKVTRQLIDPNSVLMGTVGQSADSDDVQTTVDRLNRMRAVLGPVLPLEPGIDVEYTNPSQVMPNPEPMLKYIDFLMSMVFANEGAMLGSQAFGSYALARVQDDKFMRSAPAYALSIVEAFDQLMRWMVHWNFDPLLVDLPVYTFRFAGTQDASAWTRDMALLIQSKIWEWPREARRMAAVNMGLSPQAFEDMDGLRQSAMSSLEGQERIIEHLTRGQNAN